MTFGSRMSHPSSKTRISALEKLKQSNAAKLELETRKMEERIRCLKEKMMKEKEERERLGGSRWTSGRTGPLTKTAQKSPGSKKNHSNGIVNKAPRKIKILADEPVDNYIRKGPAIPASNNRINICGQCESVTAAWLCHECSEKYCGSCFNQFHLKGALRKHTKIRVGTEDSKQSEQPTKSLTGARQEDSILSCRSTTETATMQQNDYMNGPSLLNGSYDEKESANSFAQALQEWRNQNKAEKKSPRNPPVCTDTSCGTSNGSITDGDDKKELKIKFNSSISYGDRLYLKKNRENNLGLQRLPSKANESGKKEGKEAIQKETGELDRGLAPEEKENDEPGHHFAPNYREMIQNITGINSDPNIVRLNPEENVLSRPAVSVQEVLSQGVNTEDDQGTTYVIEEYEEPKRDYSRPASRHGAVTISEMYSPRDYEKGLQQTTSTLDTHNYVSPSIASKPFFLKPTGKNKKNKQPTRTVSAGRKKTPRRDEKCRKKEQQSPKLLSKKSELDTVLPLRQIMNESSSNPVYQTNESSRQLPLKTDETISNTSHLRPRPPSDKSPAKSQTRIPIRQAWKPKPTHKELSAFFLTGVEEDSENVQKNKEIHSEGSSSAPLTNLGRGSLSSTWNPVESYPWMLDSLDSIDMSSNVETSTLQKQHYETSTATEQKYNNTVAEIDNSDDLHLTSDTFGESEDLREGEVSKNNTKNNSSNEEDELLELTALDDFDTADQDDDDLATLNDLAWELASSTGRLTRCEEDFHLESDDDSIEDKDGGSGLTTPCNLERSFRESIMDDFEEMERKFMEEDF